MFVQLKRSGYAQIIDDTAYRLSDRNMVSVPGYPARVLGDHDLWPGLSQYLPNRVEEVSTPML
ncbi:MAG: hypothetical protein NVSMB52_08110 [Chloroflexota bacterium]